MASTIERTPDIHLKGARNIVITTALALTALTIALFSQENKTEKNAEPPAPSLTSPNAEQALPEAQRIK